MKINGVRMSPARKRVLLWCVRTGATVFWPQGGSGWTHDDYQWPVPVAVINGLLEAGLLELHPQQLNHGRCYRVPPKVAAQITKA